MTIEWWHWLALGLVLVALEMAAAGGFYIIFFGIARRRHRRAACSFGRRGAGLGAAAAVFGPLGRVACCSSAARCCAGCSWIRRRRDVDSLVGEIATAARGHRAGRGRPRRAARHGVDGAQPRPPAASRRGSAASSSRVDGLMLFVEPEGARCMTGWQLICLADPRGPRADHHREDRGRRAAAERLRRRAARPVPRRRSSAGFHILMPFVDVDPLPPLAEGNGDRHPGAGLHHARQRAGRRRRHPLSEGAQPRARVVRHLRLHLRDHAARADDAAQRDRQDRSRPDVRGAHEHQHCRSSPSSTRRRSRGA